MSIFFMILTFMHAYKDYWVFFSYFIIYLKYKIVQIIGTEVALSCSKIWPVIILEMINKIFLS